MRASRLLAVVIAVGLISPARPWVTHGFEPGEETAAAKNRPAPHSSAHGNTPKISPECRKSIDRGTQWLLAAMRRDGMLGTDIGHPPDLGCTAIVGLVLLSAGNTPQHGPHYVELRRILDAVLNRLERLSSTPLENREQTLLQRKIGQHADLFLAALFLSQVYGEAPDYQREIRQTLEMLVDSISAAQGQDGTWGNQSWAPVLGTVLGWESLRAASSCGLRVEVSAKRAGDALLKQLKNKSASVDWMRDFYKDASCIRVLHSMHYREDPIFLECVERILKVAQEDHRPFAQAGGEEFLAFFLVTECMLKEGPPAWKNWYPRVSERLLKIQNADGSWTGHHCITHRTFCTAAALLTLQAPNCSIPISDL